MLCYTIIYYSFIYIYIYIYIYFFFILVLLCSFILFYFFVFFLSFLFYFSILVTKQLGEVASGAYSADEMRSHISKVQLMKTNSDLYCYTILYCTVLYCAVRCCTILYYCYAMLCYAILYSSERRESLQTHLRFFFKSQN